MVEVGDLAPDFRVPRAAGSVTTFSLSASLDEAPIVLAFFPLAFTGTCRTELETFDRRHEAFRAVDATVYGVSVDSPYALNAFRESAGLTLPLLSDFNRTVVDAYDLRTTLESPTLEAVAARAVVVIDADRRVAWRWQADDPGEEPDYDAVLAAARGAGAAPPEGVIRSGDDETP